MRLIDADKLKEDVLDLPNCPNEFSDTYDKARILDLVDEQPAVDAEPVRHGYWIENDNGTYSCSECHSWIPNEQYYYARYCLHCGARMGEVENADN